MPTVAPYGTWSSPISADIVSGNSITFNEVHTDAKSGRIYVIEGRPAEKGRCCIVEQSGTETTDILPAGFSARSQVHEYGGAAMTVTPNGDIIFTDGATKGVFRLSNGDIQPILHPSKNVNKNVNKNVYFADFNGHPVDSHWLLAVREDHCGATVENTLVAINSKTKETTTVAQGADFYSHPRFSHDGKKVAWMLWNHPDMPWNGTELYVADWEEGKVLNGILVAGKARTESICQPKWDSNQTLYFTSDRTGYWQIYYLDAHFKVRSLVLDGFEKADLSAKEGRLGNSTYVILNSQKLIVTFTKDARDGLLLVDKTTGKAEPLAADIVWVQTTSLRRLSDTQFVVVGATGTTLPALYLIDITTPSAKKQLKSSVNVDLPASIYSKAEQISFARTFGDVRLNELSHAIFTSPHNPDFAPPAGAKPPLIVAIHGGPTSHHPACLDLDTQYWTSRGFAYVHVNYAGSTGYGRAYREILNGYWGKLDVADAASCAAFLGDSSRVDSSRIGIVGPSAGGYTVLQALVSYPDVWAGGVCYFGIGNVKALMDMTHKYESEYGNQLLFGDNTDPAYQERICKERSPCYHTEVIRAPLLLLQGSNDPVVPLNQAQEMEERIKERGGDVKLVVFEGEGHGFRMQENVKQALVEEGTLWARTLVQ